MADPTEQKSPQEVPVREAAADVPPETGRPSDARLDDDCSAEAGGTEDLRSEIDRLRAELDLRKGRINELALGIQEQKARYDASRERLERELRRAVSRSKGQLLERLLQVLDNFQHSLDSIPVSPQTAPIIEGVKMIYRQFLTQLDDLGLEQYDPIGQPFDPSRDEAVEIRGVGDPDQDGRVLQTLRPGYRHEERVLRAAQVAVGRLRAEAAEQPEPASKTSTP